MMVNQIEFTGGWQKVDAVARVVPIYCVSEEMFLGIRYQCSVNGVGFLSTYTSSHR